MRGGGRASKGVSERDGSDSIYCRQTIYLFPYLCICLHSGLCLALYLFYHLHLYFYLKTLHCRQRTWSLLPKLYKLNMCETKMDISSGYTTQTFSANQPIRSQQRSRVYTCSPILSSLTHHGRSVSPKLHNKQSLYSSGRALNY